MTKYQRMLTNEYQISTKDYVRIYKLFMQNKPNFRNDKMNITLGMTTNYKNLSAGSGQEIIPKSLRPKIEYYLNTLNKERRKYGADPY